MTLVWGTMIFLQWDLYVYIHGRETADRKM